MHGRDGRVAASVATGHAVAWAPIGRGIFGRRHGERDAPRWQRHAWGVFLPIFGLSLNILNGYAAFAAARHRRDVMPQPGEAVAGLDPPQLGSLSYRARSSIA